MGLPLPKVVSDVGPGGGIVTSMRGMNALGSDMLDNVIKGVQAKYAPLTTQAEAASKLAYANLMGPQFLAKLMGNSDILANIPDGQKNAILQRLQQAGMGQGTGNALMAPPTVAGQGQSGTQVPAAPEGNSFSGFLKNAIQGITGGGQTQPSSGNPFSYNAPQQAPAQGAGNPVDVNPIIGNQAGSEQAQAVNAWMKSPEAAAQARQQGMYTIPDADKLIPWYRAQQGQGGNPPYAGGSPTFAENVGSYQGVKEEGKEAGKIRADDIKDLNDTAFKAQTAQTTLDGITKILASPEFEQIRQVPLLGHHELSYYSKMGTPAQQQMVGQYYTMTGNIIKDSARDFAGQFRKGEQTLLQGMKPAPGDTVDTARGKTEALSYMNQMLAQRSRLTAQIMNQQHINKGDAQEIADKQVNGEEVRQKIHDSLNPTVTIRNKRTGEVMTIPAEEARTKYGVVRNG